MIELGALLRVPCVDVEMGFDISPDGRRVAFSWNLTGRWEIYEQDLLEKERASNQSNTFPRKLSLGPGAKFNPRYSPDGSKLAFAVDNNGSENFHIFLHDFDTGDQKDLTPKINASLQASFTWSPDGRRIAFISDQTGHFTVFVLSLLNGEMVQVLDAGYPAWKVCWSPDGNWLAVTVEASGIDYGTFIIPAYGGPTRRISDENAPIDAGQVCWSPDSQRLVFSSDVHNFNNIAIYDLNTDRITWVTEGDGEKQFPVWSPNGQDLAYVLNLGTVSWLALQKPGGSARLYQVEPGVHYLPHFTPDGSSILFVFDNPRYPDDLWRLDLQSGLFTQLSHSLPNSLVGAPLPMPEEITYAGLDGTPIPALIFKPENRKPAPAVILIHGGPDWLFEMTWYPLMAHMASLGWVVLVPNYRGSTGYGRIWQAASRFDFGGVDTDDIAAGAIFLQSEGSVDPDKIGVTGRSHGGYLTASCLTRYPHLWATGSAVVPFLNWFTNHSEIRADLQQWDLENFGDPVENEPLWRERSPSFFLDRIQVPLQLICGRQDARCPVSDSIEAAAVLEKLGRDVELKIYEDEGHTFLKLENVLDSETRRVNFLAKYLDGKEH